ncbi:MAG: MOSC N-terminal beta barrel domain-containing protein [Planctomycetia bacterium]
MPTLDRITLYPVKSLDGVDVEEAHVLPSGSLEHDRRWRLIDMEGRVVNAKRTAAFHPIRAEFDLAEKLVTLSRWADPPTATAATFALVPGRDGPCGWLSEALGIGVLLEERPDGGFPDDRDAPGPTLVSTASLVEVARWFGFDLAESRRRFRANLEIGGCDAFWEDTLASPAGQGPPARRRRERVGSPLPAGNQHPANPRPGERHAAIGPRYWLATLVFSDRQARRGGRSAQALRHLPSVVPPRKPRARAVRLLEAVTPSMRQFRDQQSRS